MLDYFKGIKVPHNHTSMAVFRKVCYLDIERFIGIWMLIAFVFSFVSFNIFIVWHTFFYTSVNKRKANMFVDLTSHSDHESEFLSRAYNFLNKRSSSNLNHWVEGNNPSRGVFNILSRARAEGSRQDPTGQAPAPTTPSRSVTSIKLPVFSLYSVCLLD